MQSMTGFGYAAVKGADWMLEISIKSVNSRFLDIKFYSPACYVSFEPGLKKLISQQCQRGFFVVRIERNPPRLEPKLSLVWNKRQALKWKSLYAELSRELKLESRPSVENLIQKEGVVCLREEPVRLSLQEKKALKATFLRALSACLKERKREGLSLKKDILLHLRELRTFVRQMRSLSKKQQRRSLLESVKKPLEERLTREPVFEVDKTDINEEIVRVREHLRHFGKIAGDKTTAPGRKMDFYSQEILREINTMGAKAVTADFSRLVVEAKSRLEKIKEQAQNAE